MEKSLNNKTAILSAIMCFVFLALIVGVTYAALNVGANETGQNSISLGTISISYAETSNYIQISNAISLTDEQGISQSETGTFFEFTVSSTSTGSTTLPYQINIIPSNTNTIDSSYVKLYLTDGTNTPMGQYTDGAVIISDLNAGYRENSKLIYTDSLSPNQNTVSKTYRLRVWLSSDYQIELNDSNKTYSLTINVDNAPVS